MLCAVDQQEAGGQMAFWRLGVGRKPIRPAVIRSILAKGGLAGVVQQKSEPRLVAGRIAPHF